MEKKDKTVRIYPREVIIAYIDAYIGEEWAETGEWINTNSVFYSDSKKKLGFNINKGFVNDWKEGNWPLEKFVSLHLDITEERAREKLFKIYMDLITHKKVSITPVKRVVEEEATYVELSNLQARIIPPTRKFSENIRGDIRRKAKRFLDRRGITDEHIEKYKITYVDQRQCWYCSGDDEDCPVCKGNGWNPYYGRIIIPTYENNKLVYFQARDFMGSTLRYRNPSVEKKYVLYFSDILKADDRIIISEGAFDAMTLKDYSSTCLMGPTINDFQIIKIMKKTPREIIICPDFDPNPETNESIFRLVNKNIQKIFKYSTDKTKVGVYEWYNIPNIKKRLDAQREDPDRFKDDMLKDINDFQVNKVDDSHIRFFYKDKLEDLKERLKGV